MGTNQYNGTAQRLQVTFATPPTLINSPLQQSISLHSLEIARWNSICHNTDTFFRDDYNIFYIHRFKRMGSTFAL